MLKSPLAKSAPGANSSGTAAAERSSNYRAALLAALGLLTGPVLGDGTNLNFKAELSLKEGYDSNVYIQDIDPKPANVAAARAAGLNPVSANHSSSVTTILPKIGLEYKPLAAFNLSAAYAPDINFYPAASSENYVTQRGLFNFGGKIQDTAWELMNTATYIDGSDKGPTFARPDDIPAIGGIPLRDRRAAFIFRNGFRLTQPVGDDWFIRPVASSYIHDFKTDQLYVPPAIRTLYSYENYIDRQDISGGLDLGYKVSQGTHVLLGYRYGQQDQFQGPYGKGGAFIDSPFDNSYNRVLVGVEGSPVDWMKLNILVGPDFRQFSSEALQSFIAINPTYKAFDPNEVLCFLDASIVLLPTKADTVTLKSTRFEQPAFSSFSMYQDFKNDLIWRHRFNDQFSATLGFTLYIGDWQPPVNRDDWVYTPSISFSYAVTSKFTAEVGYSYDWVDSKVPASVEPLTLSHEFTRHLASLGLRYTF